jgi:tetratricopeptide (TPR) repeat protein
MKKLTKSFSFFLTILFLNGCTSRDASVKEINRSLDSVEVIFTKPKFDSTAIFSVSKSITAFINKYPNDSLSPRYLLALGTDYQKSGMYLQAISVFKQLQKKYPGDSSCEKALFYEAFLYANTVNRFDSAKILYQLYLSKYADRDSSITKIVHSELKYLGKTPEEILAALKKDSGKK